MRKLREEQELTQRELAERLRKPRSFVSKIEQAERRMDAVELIRWCRGCGSDPAGLFAELMAAVPR